MKENEPMQMALAWAADQLDPLNHTVQSVQPLRVEASQRQFLRLTAERASWVLMISPPHLERNEQFLGLAEVFTQHGVPVPAVLAHEPATGLFLLSDLGSQHLEDVYNTPQEAEALEAAISMLAHMAPIQHPLIEPYTRERFEMELGIFEEWFCRGLLGHDLDLKRWHACSELLIAAIEQQPGACVHRDYHCRNVLYDQGRLGIVDFQDALHGPILYDIASLLRDCYYEFSAAQVEHWLARYIAQAPQLQAFGPDTIRRWFDFTAIQRQLKAIGIFARLHLRDGKSSHLSYINPLLQRLITLCADYPELAHLAGLLTQCAALSESPGDPGR